MRHRLVVLAAVLAMTGVAGCSRDKDDRPAPQAQPPVAGASAPPAGASAPPGTVAPPATSAGTTRDQPAGPTDPAGAAKGHPQTLPTGTQINAVGIGPYSVGQQESALATAKLVGPVKSGATGCDSGTGVAKWGSPTLFFVKGKLQHVKITSAAVQTTSGIKVGSSEASVRTAYPEGSVTTGRAWYVPTGDFALLFRLAGGKVTAVEAGPASILQTGSPGC
jgi:hypothetical protein